MVWLELVVALVVILAGATYFTNGVEWIGEGLGLTEGAVGSVLAAVGTALPETALPFVAILSGRGAAGDEIGVGSILGGPFMLSTLAMLLLGASVLFFSRGGRRPNELQASPHVIRQDLGYFAAVYALAVVAGLWHARPYRWVLVVVLLCGYALYVRRHFQAPDEPELEAEATGEVSPLYFRAWVRRAMGRPAESPPKPPIWASSAQTFVALAMIVGGAKLFVAAIESLAHRFGVPALPFSLLVAPVATELPELSNSVLWIRRRKDTLAVGNVTGAMVFQSTFPVTIGLLFTPWRLGGDALVAALVALGSATVLWAVVRFRGAIHPAPLLFFGLVFAAYATFVIATL